MNVDYTETIFLLHRHVSNNNVQITTSDIYGLRAEAFSPSLVVNINYLGLSEGTPFTVLKSFNLL